MVSNGVRPSKTSETGSGAPCDLHPSPAASSSHPGTFGKLLNPSQSVSFSGNEAHRSSHLLVSVKIKKYNE